MKRRTLFKAAFFSMAAIATRMAPIAAAAGTAGMATGEKDLIIVAHEDDDLLFINPDIQQAISRGVAVRTVFVTAGEFNGDSVSREHYAEQRELGIRAAYANMAAVANQWTVTTESFEGRLIELDTLTAAPNVQVMFLTLPDGGDSLQSEALTELRQSTTFVANTIVPTGSPVTQSYPYDQAQLTAVLVDIMTEFAPTVIRTQDNRPDSFLDADHPDHVAVANFVQNAADVYGGRPVLVHYRDYNIQSSPANLSPDIATPKANAYAIYRAFDSQATVSPGWTASHYPRWGLGTSWAAVDGQGRTYAFGVQGGVVMVWANGAGPVSIGGSELSPNLTACRNADGRVEVFGVSMATGNIMTSFMTTAGVFSGWVDLGNPTATGATGTGTPIVGTNADGRMQVFVKNSGGGISTKWQTSVNGTFSGWLDMRGSDVQGSPAVITRANGRMELFAATRGGVLNWSQVAPNANWTAATTRVTTAVSSSPTVAANADGRLEIFYRTTAGAVGTLYETTSGGWTTTTTNLAGNGGVGDIAATTAADGRIFLMERDKAGALSTTAQTAVNASFANWTSLGGATPGTPSLINTNGTLTALAIGDNDALFTATATQNGFTPWQNLG